MACRLSTKRQSNLEIRTHHRLLPRKVAKPKEQQHLLKKHNQLRHWAIQCKVNNTNDALLTKLLRENYDTIKLSDKYYSEKRRDKFDKMTKSLRDTESKFIRRTKSTRHAVTDKNDKEEAAQPSLFQRVFTQFKSLLCCGC